MREPAEAEKFTVRINEREGVTALLYAAAKKNRAGITVSLGHGAGGNQMSAIMCMFAIGLAARGLDVMTFNFLYTEQGRGAPDPKTKLEACYRAVIEAALKHKKLKGNRLVVGGKSMGGRIASQVAAEDENDSTLTGGRASARLAGLVFLGYPLHPPGKPDQMRDAHLKFISAPMLFVQGSRDAFGLPEELRAVIERDRLSATLQVIDGGDHSFKVPKTSSLPQQQVYETTMDQIARWLKMNINVAGSGRNAVRIATG
ncbi:MAG TPA: alpha/beta family hydrolase [Pyrinomonadaceae bacterium]|nr:alpha/beta family hydrolase [Pyrinomonadaceae bacterium]